MWVFIAALCIASSSSSAQVEGQQKPETAPASKAQELEQIATKLKELEAQRADLDKQIESLRQKVQEISRAPRPVDDFEVEAAKHAGLKRMGESVTIGDLRITLVSYSYEKRWFKIQKRFDLEERGPVEGEVSIFGPIVRVENLSDGRVAQPFKEPNMFGGIVECVTIDNWGNSLTEGNLQSSEYEVKASSRSGFSLPGDRIMPKSTKDFLFAVNNPEVENAKYLVVLLRVKIGADEEMARFFVPIDQVPGFKEAAAARSKEGE